MATPKSKHVSLEELFNNLLNDNLANALKTIGYEHHEIHDGNHFKVENVVDLAINNVFDIQITTPDTAKWAHLTFFLDTESETQWFLYENVNIILAGTSVTALNNNRNSAKVSGLTLAIISNTSVANANLDTAVAGATLLAQGISGAGKKVAGFDERGREIILKQNEDYSLRFVATAAGYVDYDLDCYEHENK